ncbi:NUDIX hydrolase [Alkalihalobacillus sp. BA299]|uniref:NUDIX hydrolase n=1 Tax=Alkalihalobacillus sp. BA299 TaxID=2815938 RepID=UPI001ADD0B19|nr:NUDIX hydrolase [Alkalihalobacillus sp. BA299]
MTVIPKPASTVILIDDISRVYLTKRPKTMKFLGGFYVFPGGTVEQADNIVENKYIMNCVPHDVFSGAHYVAAARELFEEVGVFLGTTSEGVPIQIPENTADEYRQLLINREISFLDILKYEGCLLDFEKLQYFGNRLTPKGSPFRFDTRFFLARLPKGQSPKPDSHEIADAFWITPEDALLSHQKGELSMVSPTVVSLRTLLDHQKGAPLMMPERQKK